jgi:hypothetical protein
MDEKTVARFMKHVDKRPDGCWLWTAVCVDGYGRFYMKDKSLQLAHRISYLIANGNLPINPLVVRHKCKAKNCVNPDHLESGTVLENQTDRIRDGTDTRGAKNCNAKLTNEQVLEIRQRDNEASRDLAKEFGVSHPCICYIKKRITYKNI